MVGIRYRGEGIFRFGFDANKDAATYNQLEQLNGTFTELDLPYLGINEWVDDIIPNVDAGFTFTGLSSSLCVAVFVNEIETSTKDLLTANEFKMEIYPNPVSDELTTSLTLTERSTFVEYEITDATGRRIFNQRKNGALEFDKALFNVTALPAGQYFFTVRTEQGYTTQPFTVKR
ncbi:MAG: T9SS type A sorting domain-containing protein [Saprospiraceae bacterium]|nr:T9SS type A sorting domain-containing protein [Saprospiraceae bacterium]